MKLSELIRDLKTLERTIGYDADVVLFTNGYKKPKIELGNITTAGRYEDYIVISGDGKLFSDAIDCIDQKED